MRDAAVRTNLVEHLTDLIAGSDAWTPRRRSEFVGSLKSKPGLRRYLRRTKSGLLRIDAAAAKREAHLDGKWLLRTSDATLTPEDLAAAYKQLLAVERGWRDMKSSLGLRPVLHYREDRIRAHVQLCWLAGHGHAVVVFEVPGDGVGAGVEAGGGQFLPVLDDQVDDLGGCRPRHGLRASLSAWDRYMRCLSGQS